MTLRYTFIAAIQPHILQWFDLLNPLAQVIPLANASIFAQLTYTWITDIMVRMRTHPLLLPHGTRSFNLLDPRFRSVPFPWSCSFPSTGLHHIHSTGLYACVIPSASHNFGSSNSMVYADFARLRHISSPGSWISAHAPSHGPLENGLFARGRHCDGALGRGLDAPCPRGVRV